jgi:hypothetical protein
MRLTGLLDAWDQADALGRRELLAALFIELDVRDGMIWRGQPQPEVAEELIEHGFGGSSPSGTLFEPLGPTRRTPAEASNQPRKDCKPGSFASRGT